MIPFTTCGETFEPGIKFLDQTGQRSSGDDHGVLATDGDKQLIWYSKGATKVLRSITCTNAPIDAIICDFPVVPRSERIRSCAIAILLTSELLQLHLFNGETFDIHLPFPMTKMYSSSAGLILQRKLSSLEFLNELNTNSININSHFTCNDGDINRDSYFDVKLWLDESDGEQQKKFEATHSMIESPPFRGGTDQLLSPQYSVADSLEKYIHTSVGLGPSSCFFSLAHPTAPVRPVRLIVNDATNSTSRVSKGQSRGENRSVRYGQKAELAGEEIKAGPDFMGLGADYKSPFPLPSSHCTDNRKISYKDDNIDRRDIEHQPNDRNLNDLDDDRFYLHESAEHSILAAEGNLLCTLQRGTTCIVLWRVGQIVVSAGSEQEHEQCVESSEHSQNLTNISLATSTTVANSSVLDGRRFVFRDSDRDRDRDRDLNSSPSSFLNHSASGMSRQASISLHSNSNTLSMNVSHSSGGSGSAASSAGGMITSALMPFESLSGPSISLERDIRRSTRVSNANRGIKSTYTGSAGSRYASSSVTQSALSPAFSASPMSIDQVPPTRQSSRLANQRRTASQVDKPMSSTRSAYTASPMTPFLSPGPVYSLSERERDMERQTIFTSDLSINTAEALSASKSHRTTPDQRVQSPGMGSHTSHISLAREEEKEHTLCSDTNMTALTVIDLASLQGLWPNRGSTGKGADRDGSEVDLEKNLNVTFSGGEKCLGGLQIHFFHASRGAHTHFEIMSSLQSFEDDQMPPTVYLRRLPSVCPSGGSLTGGLCSIAHLQIPLNDNISQESSNIEEFGLGRVKGSLTSIPISIVMYRQGSADEQLQDGMKKSDSVDVSVLIGGQPVGGRRPFMFVDILDFFPLSATALSPFSVSNTIALHSLGISGTHILCVNQPTSTNRISSPEQSCVLSGPRGLFQAGCEGGVNGVVAQAICCTFNHLKIITSSIKGTRERKGWRHDSVDSSVDSRSIGERHSERACEVSDSSVLVVNILALMLLIQSEVGAPHVLRLLLSSAFGLALGDRNAHSSACSEELHSRVEEFFFLCSTTVQSDRETPLEGEEGLTVRAVLFDVCHSVLQDQLLRGKSAAESQEGSCVRVLCEALCSVVESVHMVTASFSVDNSSSILTQEDHTLSITESCCDSDVRNGANDSRGDKIMKNSSLTDSPVWGATEVHGFAEQYIAYYKSILSIAGPESALGSLTVNIMYGNSTKTADRLRELIYKGEVQRKETLSGGGFTFTGSPHSIPHVFDWLTECVRTVAYSTEGGMEHQGSASSQNIDEGGLILPLLYTSNMVYGHQHSKQSLSESSGSKKSWKGADRDMMMEHNLMDTYPALAFTRKFFALLLSSQKSQADNLSSAGSTLIYSTHDSQSPEKFANIFVRISKGDLTTLSLLPPPLRIFVELALHQSKESPFFPLGRNEAPGSCRVAWPAPVLIMIGRNDLCAHLIGSTTGSGFSNKARGIVGESSSQSGPKGDESISLDGLTEIEEEACRLRFADDDRVHEVCRLLRSSSGVYLRLEKAPEVSDLDHRHKLQMRLLILCRRSLACPVGRGALTLGSLTPLMAEALPCPPLSLAGRIPPNNTPLLLSTGTAPQDLSLWPEFHNGVAAGLRVCSPQENSPSTSSSSSYTPRSAGGASTVSRNWIVYNRTATADDSSFHAGVLLALGLQGHLRVLSVTDICDYLTQGNQPTTIALLVGLPASRLGTADPLLSKTLCLHVPSLLPPQHWDIEILPQVQTAALVGLGLLYCHSGHRLMTEFLLAELGRRPTSDRDKGDCREAVSFAAAWALGVVLLSKGKGKGKSDQLDKNGAIGGLGGLTDLCIEDRLCQHLEGGKRPPDSNLFPHAGVPQGDGHAAGGRSSRVMEGDQLNIGVTGPGAAVALGLIYIRSGNEEICHRLSLPQTAFALESIRPDLLLYRAVARCLVLWDTVDPTDAWIDSQTPHAVIRSLFPSTIQAENENVRRKERGKVDLDPRSALAVYLNVVTGHCWGIGLVFAGTANNTARDTLMGKLKMLQLFRDNKQAFPLSFTPNSKTLRPLVESCIGSVALALSCVMAGTGDLSCLRILRFLRWKVDDVTYGTHLSLAMAIGLLFLSGGSASLRRDPMSCACLLLATAPRFPIRTVDNQYHLQALRHLYVLAVEARALQIVDADTGSAVSVDIEVELVCGIKLLKRAPCLLPELITVRCVSLPPSLSSSSLYYPASMVITRVDSGYQSCIPHPLYVKRRPLLPLSLPSRPPQLSLLSMLSPAPIEMKTDNLPRAAPSVANSRRMISKSLLSTLTGRLCGGRQQYAASTSRSRVLLGRMQETGLVESQLGLDYLLSAASMPLKGSASYNHVRSLPTNYAGHAATIVTGSKVTRSGIGCATMSDVALALLMVGPVNDVILRRAVSGLASMEK